MAMFTRYDLKHGHAVIHVRPEVFALLGRRLIVEDQLTHLHARRLLAFGRRKGFLGRWLIVQDLLFFNPWI